MPVSRLRSLAAAVGVLGAVVASVPTTTTMAQRLPSLALSFYSEADETCGGPSGGMQFGGGECVSLPQSSSSNQSYWSFWIPLASIDPGFTRYQIDFFGDPECDGEIIASTQSRFHDCHQADVFNFRVESKEPRLGVASPVSECRQACRTSGKQCTAACAAGDNNCQWACQETYLTDCMIKCAMAPTAAEVAMAAAAVQTAVGDSCDQCDTTYQTCLEKCNFANDCEVKCMGDHFGCRSQNSCFKAPAQTPATLDSARDCVKECKNKGKAAADACKHEKYAKRAQCYARVPNTVKACEAGCTRKPHAAVAALQEVDPEDCDHLCIPLYSQCSDACAGNDACQQRCDAQASVCADKCMAGAAVEAKRFSPHAGYCGPSYGSCQGSRDGPCCKPYGPGASGSYYCGTC